MAKFRRAPIGIDISIIGDRALERKLNKLRLSTAKTVVRKAARTAANSVLKPSIDANLASAASGPFNTGNLKRLKSNVRNISAKNKRSVGVWVYGPSKEKLNIAPKDAYYPYILERGAPSIGIEPQYMFRKARDQKASAVINKWGREIGKGIEAAVKRLGGRAFR